VISVLDAPGGWNPIGGCFISSPIDRPSGWRIAQALCRSGPDARIFGNSIQLQEKSYEEGG
jgi:hypothetical protein